MLDTVFNGQTRIPGILYTSNPTIFDFANRVINRVIKGFTRLLTRIVILKIIYQIERFVSFFLRHIYYLIYYTDEYKYKKDIYVFTALE